MLNKTTSLTIHQKIYVCCNSTKFNIDLEIFVFCCKEVINVGDRIAVPRTFFDNMNIEISERYSSFLPKTVMGILGTVLHMYSRSQIKVRWDIDDSVSIVNHGAVVTKLVSDLVDEDLNNKDKENDVENIIDNSSSDVSFNISRSPLAVKKKD